MLLRNLIGNMVMEPKQRAYFEAFKKHIHNKYFFKEKIPEMKHEYSLIRFITEVSFFFPSN